MIHAVNKVSLTIRKIYLYASIFLLLIVVADCFLQIVTRVMNNSFSWTEELARYVAVWMTLCGVAVVTKDLGHAVVDIISANLKGVVGTVCKLLVNILMGFIAVVLIAKGIDMMFSGAGSQITPALQIKKAYVYAALPVGGVGMLIFLLDNSLQLFERDKTKS